MTLTNQPDLVSTPAASTDCPTCGRPMPQSLELDHLTPREREVLTMLSAGYRVRTIANVLGISQSTVRNHVSAVMAKAGVANQAELVESVLRPRS